MSASSSTWTGCRSANAAMTAYEMMLSESQERMLMVLRPDRTDQAQAIFEKWELDFAVIGHLTRDRPYRRAPPGRGRGRHPARAAGRAGAALSPADRAQPGAGAARGRAGPDRHRGCPAPADRLRGLRLACLGLGPVRQHRRRPDRVPAGGRGRRHRAHRRHPDRVGADHRLHAALRRGRCAARRRAGGGGSLAQPDRDRRASAGGHRQPQISAIPRSPR